MPSNNFGIPFLLAKRKLVIDRLQPFRNKRIDDRLRQPEISAAIADVVGSKKEMTLCNGRSADDELLEVASERERLRELFLSRVAAADSIVKNYVGHRMDDDNIKKLAIQVAGWWSDIRDGEPWTLWDGRSDVASAIYVSDITRMLIPGKRVFRVVYNAFSGQVAGMVWSGVMPGGYIQSILHDIGNRYKRYADEDFSGMWFTATIHGAGSDVAFKNINVSSSQKERNRDLIKAREQICDGPLLSQKGKECVVCPVPRSRCKRARYAEGYDKIGPCKNGHIGNMRGTADEYCHSCITNGQRMTN